MEKSCPRNSLDMFFKREIRVQSNAEVLHSFIWDDCTTVRKPWSWSGAGTFQSVAWKICITAQLTLKVNVSAFVETAFTINIAYVDSIGKLPLNVNCAITQIFRATEWIGFSMLELDLVTVYILVIGWVHLIHLKQWRMTNSPDIIKGLIQT
jgi:hypothetical protein